MGSPEACQYSPLTSSRSVNLLEEDLYHRYVGHPSLLRHEIDDRLQATKAKTSRLTVFIDEVQRLPALFPVLRSFVDRHRNRTGQVVLLGSASLSLIKQISESLAGRVGFLDMTPFQWDEVCGTRKALTPEMLTSVE